MRFHVTQNPGFFLLLLFSIFSIFFAGEKMSRVSFFTCIVVPYYPALPIYIVDIFRIDGRRSWSPAKWICPDTFHQTNSTWHSRNIHPFKLTGLGLVCNNVPFITNLYSLALWIICDSRNNLLLCSCCHDSTNSLWRICWNTTTYIDWQKC